MTAVIAARDRLPTALLVHGREGMGKTALWRATTSLCRDQGYRVLESALSRNESRLAFAGLADLISPVLSEVLPELPPPQAAALESALALSSLGPAAPDERAIAFGLHGALSILARQSPIALAVDDVQWLDPSSALMLSYAVRRLESLPVLLVFARRDGEAVDQPQILADAGFNVETIALGGLPLGAIHRLIRTRLGFSLTRPQLLSVFSRSDGNPLHALELARAIAADETAAPGGLRSLLAQRVATLPEPTRLALTLVALASDSTVEALAETHGATFHEDLAPAIAADLVDVAGGHVRFTHPLVAHAAEASVPAPTRTRLHRLLAAAAGSDEARAAHLAAATEAPNAEVADSLDRAALETRRRGARAASAALYEASARLTPPDAGRGRTGRSLAAAKAWYEAGDLGRAEAILQPLVDGLASGDARTEAAWRLGILRDDAGEWREATALWRAALAEAVDDGLRAELLCSLAITAFYTESVAMANAHAVAAVAAAEASSNPVHLARALAAKALTMAIHGDAGYRPVIERALELEAEIDEPLGDWSPSAVAAESARHAGDIDAARTHYSVVLARAANSGDSNVEQWASYGLAFAEIFAGNYARGAELADVVLDMADQTGQMRIPARSLRAHVDAYLGDFGEARRLIAEAIDAAQGANEATHLFGAWFVLGSIEMCAGDPGAAARALASARAIAAEVGLAHATALRSFLNEAEAAAAAGLADQADAAFAMFETTLRGDAPAWAGSVVHRTRAAILAGRGDLAGAERELDAAVADTHAAAPDRGRAMLALGVARRRQREHVRARWALTDALGLFVQLGSPPWVRQAEAELGRIPGRRANGADVLTDAESRIADLVAAGRSNRDVATALFLSVKTVEVTLTRVYQKLGVRTRAELAHQYGAQAKH